ncbi:MAG: hypothetical protein MUC88_05090 [Planctomycetes bacterium]|jgi:hypothetical protein|nr:hypothetical protein [Planctomycetota bacterium]
MSADSRPEHNDIPLEWVRQQLQRFHAVEPPGKLKEALLAAIPDQVGTGASSWHAWRWSRATGWVGIAATVMVLGGAIWLRMPAGPSGQPALEANSVPVRVLADYNSVRPADINAWDSNEHRTNH